MPQVKESLTEVVDGLIEADEKHLEELRSQARLLYPAMENRIEELAHLLVADAKGIYRVPPFQMPDCPEGIHSEFLTFNPEGYLKYSVAVNVAIGDGAMLDNKSSEYWVTVKLNPFHPDQNSLTVRYPDSGEALAAITSDEVTGDREILQGAMSEAWKHLS